MFAGTTHLVPTSLSDAKGFIMNTQQLAQDFQNLLVEILPELIKELNSEGLFNKEMTDKKRIEEAVVEAVVFHGNMQLYNVKKNVEDQELDKTIAHIVSNPGEFKTYLKNKIVLA